MGAIKPATVAVNACSICQLSCPGCFTAELRSRLKGSGLPAYLSASNFGRLLEGNPWLVSVEFACHGELFLNPELPDILRHAHEKGVLLTANTGVNLNSVKPAVLEALVKYRFSSICVALDGTTPESYAAHRVNGNFEAVLDNVRRINALKREYGSAMPRLFWQFLVFEHNEGELPRARAMARELGMEFAPSLAFEFVEGRQVDYYFSSVRDERLVRKELGYASLDEYRRKYGREHMQYACLMLWDSPLINYDGRPWGCCVVGNGLLGDVDFGGNALADGVEKCINGERMQYARGMLTGALPSRNDVPCSDCWLYLERKANGDWLRRNRLTNELWRLYYASQAKVPRYHRAAKVAYQLARRAAVRNARRSDVPPG